MYKLTECMEGIDMSTLLEKLKALGCAEDDLNRAKERFLNNDDFYARCFVKYLNDKSFVSLGECLKQKEATGVFEQAHTLKGVTANMGITPIYEEVVIIVEAVRGMDSVPDGIEAHYDKIMKLHEELKAMI